MYLAKNIFYVQRNEYKLEYLRNFKSIIRPLLTFGKKLSVYCNYPFTTIDYLTHEVYFKNKDDCIILAICWLSFITCLLLATCYLPPVTCYMLLISTCNPNLSESCYFLQKNCFLFSCSATCSYFFVALAFFHERFRLK